MRPLSELRLIMRVLSPLILAAVLAACATQGEQAPGPRVWIDSPAAIAASGSGATGDDLYPHMGVLDPIVVVAHSSSDVPIVRSVLSVDGDPHQSQRYDPGSQGLVRLEHVWEPTTPGLYELQVIVWTEAGNEGRSNPVTVRVIEGTPETESDDPSETPSPSLSPSATESTITATWTPSSTAAALDPSDTPTNTPRPEPSDTPTRTPSPTTPPSGTISGVLYEDLDADGSRDEGEPTISGATIRLRSGSCGGSQIASAATEGGVYLFENLAAGSYCVELDEGSLPPASGVWHCPTTARSVSLAPDENRGAVNFACTDVAQ